ncbi:B12-binding domain-containing radical SAM protein [Streptomyces sp. NPDC050659]
MVTTYGQAHGLEVDMADLSFDQLSDKIGPDTRAAVFSLYIDDFDRGIAIARDLKASHPGITTFVGGPHATMVGGQDVLRVTDAFDYVGVGDCLPEAMPIIAEACRGRSLPENRVITGSTFDARMDSLSPDYAIWGADRYFPLFPVEFSRGCRQRCPFCTDPVLRRGLAVDPVERTMRTVEGLVRRHGPICVRFVDSSLSSLGSDLDVLLDALITANLPVTWSAFAYPHDMTLDLASRMAAAGCRAVFMGIETMAQGVRTGKHHTKHPEEIARSVEVLHANGIFVHGNFIIGLPGETPDTVSETLDGLRTVQFDSVGGGPFYLAPGSTFARRPSKFGIDVFDPEWQLRAHQNFYEPIPYFRTATLTQLEMRELATRFQKEVEDSQLGCWNLSDFAVLCWLSIGGDINDLKRLWSARRSDLSDDARHVMDVLKERSTEASSSECRAEDFVALATRVAHVQSVQQSHST